MKRVAITSPTSMLGSMFYNILRTKYKLLLVLNDERQRAILEEAYGSTNDHEILYFNVNEILQDYTEGFPETRFGLRTKRFFETIGDVDAFVNCSSVTKPHLLDNVAITFFINAVLPHLLSRYFGSKLIHTSTDCVFSGLIGAPYSERAQTCPTDLYGMTRSLGEPYEQSLVLRTSIIGPEIEGASNIVSWVRGQAGKSIRGFRRHLWNGITSKQYAKIIDSILQQRTELPENGVFHIFSTDTSKYDLITAIAHKYHVDVKVEPDDSTIVDRRLCTEKNLNDQLHIPNLQTQLNEM